MSELLPAAQQYNPVFFGKRLSDTAISVLRERFSVFCQGEKAAYISPMVATDTLLPSVRPSKFILSDADRNVVDTVDWFHLDAGRLRQKYLEKAANLGEEEYSVFRKQFNRLKGVPFAEKASLYLSMMRCANKSFAPYDANGNFVATYAYNEKVDAEFCAAVEEWFCAFKATPDVTVAWHDVDDALMASVDTLQESGYEGKAVVYIDLREACSTHPERAKVAAFCTMAVNRMRGSLKVFIMAYDIRSLTTMFSVNPVDEPLKHHIDQTDKRAIPEVLIEVG